jgi:hypothetical protein
MASQDNIDTSVVLNDWKNEHDRCRISSSFSCSFSSDEELLEEEESSPSSSVHSFSKDIDANDNDGDTIEGGTSSGRRNSRATRGGFNRARLWKSIGPYCVLLLCLFAAGLTFVASWSCNTFLGAEMPWFVGGGYGIWSLEDSQYNCQLWSVLFFAYQLDAPLRAARFLSMTAMLLSLASLAILTQIVPWGRIGSWVVACALMFWLGDSISYWWRFNVWSTFFILTYFFMVLVVKCFLLEHYAPQTLWRVVGRRLFLLACFGSVGIFCILASRVCMCEELSEEELEQYYGKHDDASGSSSARGRDDDGDFSGYTSIGAPETFARPEHCSGMCVLGPTSITAVMTPFLWATAWLVAFAVPSSQFSARTGNQVAMDNAAADSQEEEQQRVILLEEDEDSVYNEQADHDPQKAKEINDCPTRPRLGTAATFAVMEDDDEEDQYDRQRSSEMNDRVIPSSPSDTTLAVIKEATPAGDPRTLSQELQSEAYFHSTQGAEKEEDNDDVSNLQNVPSSDETITANNSSDPFKRKRTRWRRIEHGLLGIVTTVYVLVVLVMVGTYFENKNAAKAPDTSYNFITDVVCAFHPLDPNRPFETFDTTIQAKEAGYQVAHCGACGECSNPFDIEKYVETRKTVAESAKKCSMEAIFGKDVELTECLEREIGFTRSCTGCWADNMRMTAKHCMWTCLSSMLIGVASSNNVEDAQDYDWLNQCIFCDEKRSGPDFVECSGVARRRLGIQSEFERNPREQCPNVEIDYVASNLSQVFP